MIGPLVQHTCIGCGDAFQRSEAAPWSAPGVPSVCFDCFMRNLTGGRAVSVFVRVPPSAVPRGYAPIAWIAKAPAVNDWCGQLQNGMMVPVDNEMALRIIYG